MKVIDAGTESMTNADVLAFFKRKREQYANEDAREKKAGRKPKPLPKNLTESFDKHERHLNSDQYPYTRNPTAYPREYSNESMKKFQLLVDERICRPVYERYTGTELTPEEVDKALSKELEEKKLTEPEMLMLLNNAPQCVELLQPMIENWEDRFTGEEMEIIVQAIMEVYRCDET